MKRALSLLASAIALLVVAAPAASAVPMCPATSHACGCGIVYPVGPLRTTACILA